MKTLIIGNSKSVFAKELQGELVLKGKNVYLLDFESLDLFNPKGEVETKYSSRFVKYKSISKFHMFFRITFIGKIIKSLEFDIVNIHVARWYYVIILKTLSKRKLVVSFYGSDFYRSSRHAKKLLYPLLKIANGITFTNEKTKESFLKHYKDFKEKSKVCRFGLKTLDFIDKNRSLKKIEIKKELGYSLSKKIVTCGYNASPAQQHEKIIENIIKLSIDNLENTQFIFPMTYGDKNHREKIKNILKDTGLDYIVLEDFLYDYKNANIKLASDVMINILKTDSFSGSMQEFLYAKNIVITGEWLPYGVFDSEGIIFEKISLPNMLLSKLEDILLDMEHYKRDLDKNIDIIAKLSSWSRNIPCWTETLK